MSRRLVFECDDAIHLGDGTRPIEASLTSDRLRTLLPLSDCVIVTNHQLEQDLRELGARDVVVFPGPAPSIMPASAGGRRGVLWLGSPSTYRNVRSILYPAIEILPSAVELTVIGASRERVTPRITERPWSPSAQATALQQARVGVAPQQQDEWSLRKAFYKVLEYLAAGVIPVVPDYPAVRALLGDELETVAITVPDDSPASWASAIASALTVEVDDSWLAARDRIFARWSADRLSRVIVG